MKGLPTCASKKPPKIKAGSEKSSQGNPTTSGKGAVSENSLSENNPLFIESSKKYSNLKIGVLALQGAFAKHCEMIEKLGAQATLVKKPEDLKNIDALIIPGGESTTMLRQIDFIELFPALSEFAKKKPLFGTCAGLILMSREINFSHQSFPTLNILDIAIERNAFGRQIESFKADIEVTLPASKIITCPAIFIRAPRIKQTGPEVSILATYKDEPVLVKQGIHLGSSFHPELTNDPRIHHYFLSQVEKNKNV